MRPPECRICDERFDPPGGGDAVSFAVTAEVEDWRRRSQGEGFVGHPPNLEWFCAEHVGRARELCHLPLAEAMMRWSGEPEAVQPDTEPLSRDQPSEPSQQGAELAIPPAHVATLAERCRERAGAFFDLLGAPVPDALTLVTSEDKTWSPMDGAVAPNCPFEIHRVAVYEDGDMRIEIRTEVNHWNDDKVANSSFSVSASASGASLFIVGNTRAPTLARLLVTARNLELTQDSLEAAVLAILRP